MKLKLLISTCVLLCICMLLNSCFFMPMGPSLEFQRKKAQGFYPDTADFPNTKWVCREINMYFYMLDYEEGTMVGEYTYNGKSYRVLAGFAFSALDFNLISSTKVSESEYKVRDTQTPLISCESDFCGNINTEYIYENGTIVCSVRNYRAVDGECIPNTLTFDKVESIAQQPETRWYCEELDMYIDSFYDAKGYYRGSITIDGKQLFVHAYEIGNSSYFEFMVENGVLNNLRAGTTTYLIYMYLEVSEDQIVAKITDDMANHPQKYNDYWTYQGSTLTFSPGSIDKN